MSKILITGGSGYVGSYLVPHLINLGHKVSVLDLMIYGENNLKKDENLNIKSIELEISKRLISIYFRFRQLNYQHYQILSQLAQRASSVVSL